MLYVIFYYKEDWPFGQLRYLQTLNSIAAEHNSTIIFPMPINLVHAGKSLFQPSSTS